LVRGNNRYDRCLRLVLRKGYTYYVFFDIDGSYWVLQVTGRSNYITYEEFVGVLVSCFPSAVCDKMVGGVVRVDAVDVDYYTIMYFRVGSSVIRVVSGGLRPFEGKMVFVHGLRYGDLIKKINSGDEHIFRNMFYIALAQLSDLEGKCKDTVEAVLKNLSDAIKHVKQIAISTVENTNKMLGFIAKPEAVMAAEAALSMVTPMAAPQQITTPTAVTPSAPKKSLFERIKEKIVSLFGRRKVQGAVESG